MTNKEILQADMLDILFEHRNKSYGAYTLRRYYNNRLIIAVSIALSVVVLFYLISLLNGSSKESGVYSSDNTVTLTDIDIKPPKEIEPPPQVKKEIPVAQVKDVIIKIVPDELANTEVPDQTQIAENVISNKNIDGPPAEDPNKSVTNVITGSDRKEDSKNETTFIPVEVQPSFPGGPEALALFFSRNLSSPTDLEAGEKKIVMVRFVVGADGAISSAEITQSGGDSYDREVLRAFKRMPKWNPAIQNGSKIAVSFTQPVTFVGVEQ